MKTKQIGEEKPNNSWEIEKLNLVKEISKAMSYDYSEYDAMSNNDTPEEVAVNLLDDFITKTLQQQREDLIKEIEGIKRLPNMAQNQNGNEYCSACGCPWDNIDNYCPDCATHNQALVDIIKILENK